MHIDIIAAPAHACSMHLFLTIYIQVSVIKCRYIHCIAIPALAPANVGSSSQSLTQEFWQNCLVALTIASASPAPAICVFEK